MSKTARVTLIVISLILFLGIPALSVVRIWQASSSGDSRAQQHFAAVVQEVREASELLAEAEYDRFADALRPVVEDNSDLSLLLVTRQDGGIDYGWSRTRSRLPEHISDVDFEPNLSYRDPWEQQLDARIGVTESSDLVVTAVYTTLEANLVFQTLRDGLLTIITFALLVLIVLIASLKPESYASEPERPEGARVQNHDSAPQESGHDAAPASSPASSETTPETSVGDDELPDPNAYGDNSGPPLVSPKSGLSFSAHLPRRLSLELERAAENDLDLSVFMIQIRDAEDSPVTSAVLGRLVLEQFPFEDLAFEYSDARICIILPGTDLDNAMRKGQRFVTLLKRHELGSFKVLIGASSRNGRLVESDRLLTEAREALARTDDASTVVGFRPDPDRYRSYIATRMGA